MEEEEIESIYDIDIIYHLGVSVERQTKVYTVTEKTTGKEMAIRLYEVSPPRPNYDQWLEHKMLNPQRELFPAFDRNFMFCIGDPAIKRDKQIPLMHLVASKLRDHHLKGRVHSNLHPTNIMLSDELDVVEYMDSLKGGNKGNFYSSP
jgi:hypothetical protein